MMIKNVHALYLRPKWSIGNASFHKAHWQEHDPAECFNSSLSLLHWQSEPSNQYDAHLPVHRQFHICGANQNVCRNNGITLQIDSVQNDRQWLAPFWNPRPPNWSLKLHHPDILILSKQFERSQTRSWVAWTWHFLPPCQGTKLQSAIAVPDTNLSRDCILVLNSVNESFPTASRKTGKAENKQG